MGGIRGVRQLRVGPLGLHGRDRFALLPTTLGGRGPCRPKTFENNRIRLMTVKTSYQRNIETARDVLADIKIGELSPAERIAYAQALAQVVSAEALSHIAQYTPRRAT